MNPINLLKYLEKEKGKPIPLRLKLIHDLPINPEDLEVEGRLDLGSTNVKSLPDNLKIKNGSLFVDHTKQIISLPSGLEVEGNCSLDHSNIETLPEGLKVGGWLSLEYSAVKVLPSTLYIEGDLFIEGTPLSGNKLDDVYKMVKKGYIKGIIYR
jgi:hypothetical protein